MKISGHFFQPFSSKSQLATLSVLKGAIQIEQENGHIFSKLDFETVQGSDNVHFKCGSYFRSDESLPPEFFKMFQTKIQRTIGWLEKFSLTRAIVFILLLIVAIVCYRLVFVGIGNSITVIFPISLEEEIGKNAYQTMNLAVFTESDISTQYQNQIRRRAKDIANSANLSRSVEIYFHESEMIGPNAMAFPGGPVVITDGLVDLLSNDEELLAVIAHEFAHIEERHSLKQLLDYVGVSILAYLLFGTDESIVEVLSAVLVTGWAFKNSRDFEKEADLNAVKYLEASNLDPRHFVNAIKKLTAFDCRNISSDSGIDCEERVPNWIATHPAGTVRVEYLMNEIR